MVTERQTYSMLEWLGDIGGLFDALRYIGAMLIYPIAAYNLRSKLLGSVFRYIDSLVEKKKRDKENQATQIDKKDSDGDDSDTAVSIKSETEENLKWDIT